MPKKGGDGQDAARCKVCGRRTQTIMAREITALKAHKNTGGNWCLGGYAIPAVVMNSTECPGEVIERDARGREVSRSACGAIITYGATRCPQCKLAIAPGALAGVRLPRHARGLPVKRDWAKRFMGGGE